MSKATEEDLASLHGEVARALTDAVQGTVIEDVKVPASAAHIMAAITFLKNNNITADAGANADLAALNKALADKRKKKKLSLTDIQGAAELFERELGDHMQ